MVKSVSYRKAECVLTIVMIMMATMVQFHHHDCQGNVYWHIMLDTDIELSSEGCGMESCHHDSDGHQHDHNGSCSMHIGAAVVSDHYLSVSTNAITFDIAAISPAESLIPHAHSCCGHSHKCHGRCLHYDHPQISSFHFRGPPSGIA